MDAEPNDEQVEATEEPSATDAPAAATPEGDPSGADEDSEDDDEFAHLDSLEDGAGCTEIWEHLSETRGDT